MYGTLRLYCVYLSASVNVFGLLCKQPINGTKRVVYGGNGNKTYEIIKLKKQTPWSESASELYRPSGRRLSAK
jgi:hypothetical protein